MRLVLSYNLSESLHATKTVPADSHQQVSHVFPNIGAMCDITAALNSACPLSVCWGQL